MTAEKTTKNMALTDGVTCQVGCIIFISTGMSFVEIELVHNAIVVMVYGRIG